MNNKAGRNELTKKKRDVAIKMMGGESGKRFSLFDKTDTDKDHSKIEIAIPPFDYESLSRIKEVSEIVWSSIDTVTQNVVGHGFDIVSNEQDDKDSKANKQISKCKNVFQDAIKTGHSWTSISKALVEDYETYGNWSLEVIRNKKGDIASYSYIPSKTVKPRKDKIKNNKVVKCGFVQEVDGKKIYYKNFQDTRSLDRKTGEYGDTGNEATELLYMFRLNDFSNYYGIPRYISAESSIVGNYYVARFNNNKFKNNCVPDKMIIVSNGTVISGEENLRTYFKNNFKGIENTGRALLVEIEADETDDISDKSGLKNANVQVVDLNKWEDASFLEFEKSNDKKIRYIWRIHPVLLGDIESVNRASATVAKEIAEEQVFAPLRNEFNEFITNTLIKDIVGEEELQISFRYNNMKIKNEEFSLKKAESIAKTGLGTLNEYRNLLGLEPYEDDNFGEELLIFVYMLLSDQETGDEMEKVLAGLNGKAKKMMRNVIKKRLLTK